MSEVKLKRGEPIERALRRFKRKLDRERTLDIVRKRRYHEKPSARRRRKMKEPKFNYWGNFNLSDVRPKAA